MTTLHALPAHLPGGAAAARADVCDNCGCCLKVVPSFDPVPFEMLPVEDLATFHIDCIAREPGYRPPSRTP